MGTPTGAGATASPRLRRGFGHLLAVDRQPKSRALSGRDVLKIRLLTLELGKAGPATTVFRAMVGFSCPERGYLQIIPGKRRHGLRMGRTGEMNNIVR